MEAHMHSRWCRSSKKLADPYTLTHGIATSSSSGLRSSEDRQSGAFLALLEPRHRKYNGPADQDSDALSSRPLRSRASTRDSLDTTSFELSSVQSFASTAVDSQVLRLVVFSRTLQSLVPEIRQACRSLRSAGDLLEELKEATDALARSASEDSYARQGRSRANSTFSDTADSGSYVESATRPTDDPQPFDSQPSTQQATGTQVLSQAIIQSAGCRTL
ncbi:uncharacterized protein F5Z01DRAFT_641073 [Emericellopsis atlantica]|uniref:Uncharacterized protein n=1 Tax=Emericellopsis atlantica TaxID=2614577 RepID=A0A9P7ZCV3_9HYPO|nr:uncharacterized protein F5Z01DRAFT_641073 [Emericellopsis atlantica]KAG9249566.1 hypothetical protein F5Z01DRAFT_641073 [Emericellopsis atlantica]